MTDAAKCEAGRIALQLATMSKRWVMLAGAVAVVGGGVAYFAHRPAPVVSTSQPSLNPIVPASSKPTSKPVATPGAPVTLFELLRQQHPAIAATQPLGVPVEFSDAARFVIDQPICLDNAGQLWASHPTAEPAVAVLKALANSNGKEQTHVVREPVKLVYWMNDGGRVAPALFVESADGKTRVVTANGTLELPASRSFRFSRALLLADHLAIPCDDGICVLRIGQTITEQFQPLPTSKDPLAQPQVIAGNRGLLAWTPATDGSPGSGVARYLDKAWTMLDETEWPKSIVQISAFLDGTVQQLRLADDKTIQLAQVPLDTPQVDENRIVQLVGQLDDLSDAVRTKATEDLRRIGPSAWPILKKLAPDQLPETQQRINTLLARSDAPALGSMSSVDGKLKVLARFDNAGILLFGEAGVTIPQEDNDPTTVAPAWICIRPDHSPELVPALLTEDFRPNVDRIVLIQSDWYRTDAQVGPRRYVGNALLPMLRKSERKFSEPIGSDRRGRWLFRQPGKETPVLLVDPTIADATPRLPTWTIGRKAESVGWSKSGYPAIKRGGAWELRENGWQALDEKTDPMLTAESATTQPATLPSDPGPLLVAGKDGARYFGGKQSLDVITADGKRTSMSFPATAAGGDPVTLIETPDGKLFLFNQPGRVLRLSPTNGESEPLKIDAIFSRNIPNGAADRIWLDPAGRICMSADGVIVVLFPTGVIPHDIAVKMSVEEQALNELE